MRTLILVASLALAGCTTTLGTASILSTKNLRSIPDPIVTGVRGEDCQIQWTLDLQPKLSKAIAAAIADGGKEGNGLANVTIYYSRYIWILFTQNCLTVEGDVVELD